MSAISQKSITGITSITTPAGVDNQLTLHNNNTTEAVKLDIAGNLHFHNHLNITGVSTASNFKTGTSNLHNTGLNVFDLDVDGHTNLDNVSVAGVSTFTGNADFSSGIDVTGNVTSTGNVVANGTMTVGSYGLFGSLVANDPGSNYYGTTNRFGGGLSLQGELKIDGDIVHMGDTNTKIRFPANDTFTVTTANVERFRIGSNGYIGVGDFSSKSRTDPLNVDSGIGTCNIGGNYIHLSRYSGGGTNYITAPQNNANLYISADDHIVFGVDHSSSIYSHNTEALRITSAGKVGIGTDNPSFFTHIQADGIAGDVLKLTATASGQMMNIQNKAGSSYPAIVRFVSHNGSGFWDLQYNNNDNSFSFDKNDSEKVRILSNGNFGIGTNNPSQKLEVLGTTSLFGNGAASCQWGDTSYIGHLSYSSDGAIVRAASGKALIFHTNHVNERLRIGSDGAILVSNSTGIGIGAATNGSSSYPSVTISGTSGGAIHFEDDGDLLADIYGSSSGLTFSTRKVTDAIIFQTNSGLVTEKVRINSSGLMGVGVNDPKSVIHTGAGTDIRIGGRYGGSSRFQLQVQYSSGYTGTHWQFRTDDGISWSFDGVLIVHGSGGSTYGSEVVHIKIVYSRESGQTNSGDTWRNGSVDYNVETLEHGQVGLAPSSGDLTVSHDSTPGGATGYSLLKLGWSSSGQSVGVWSKLIGTLYWGAPGSGEVKIQDKDATTYINSNP